MTTAPRKLAQFLEGAGLTQVAFGQRCGLPQHLISRYLHGLRTPGLRAALSIERATGGAIPAEAWEPRRHRRHRKTA